VGVILTGLQDDGTAGLLAVKRCGGVTIVQDPTDALYPEMPQSALAHVEVDYQLPVARMGTILYRLAYEVPGEPLPTPRDIVMEAEIAEGPPDIVNRDEALGTLAPLTCPDCGGPLWELHNDRLQRYRCRLGHAFTADSLLGGQSEAIETALWTAVRTMEERGRILMLMARRRRDAQQYSLAARCEEQATELQKHAQHLRQLLLGSL
jgi:two-component system chemotaxis response regulator CheB